MTYAFACFTFEFVLLSYKSHVQFRRPKQLRRWGCWWRQQEVATPWKHLRDDKIPYSFRFHHGAGRWATHGAIRAKRKVWPSQQNRSFLQLGSSAGFQQQSFCSQFLWTESCKNVEECWHTGLMWHGFRGQHRQSHSQRLKPVDPCSVKASLAYECQGGPEEGSHKCLV